MISIVHVRDNVPGAVYVGRRNSRAGLQGSPLGNPFRMERSRADFDPCGCSTPREQVVKNYDIHLREALAAAKAGTCTELQREMAREFDRLVAIYRDRGELALACWCAPESCHAEIIADQILLAIGRERTNGR